MGNQHAQRVAIPSRLRRTFVITVVFVLLVTLTAAITTVAGAYLSLKFHSALTVAGYLLLTQICATLVLLVSMVPAHLLTLDFSTLTNTADGPTPLRTTVRQVMTENSFGLLAFLAVSSALFGSVLKIGDAVKGAVVAIAYLTLLTVVTIYGISSLMAQLSRSQSGPLFPTRGTRPHVDRVVEEECRREYGPDWPAPAATTDVGDALLHKRAAQITARWYRYARSIFALAGASSIVVVISCLSAPESAAPWASLALMTVIGSAFVSHVWRGPERFDELARAYHARAIEMDNKSAARAKPIRRSAARRPAQNRSRSTIFNGRSQRAAAYVSRRSATSLSRHTGSRQGVSEPSRQKLSA